jgi:hypothetical protein
LNSATFAKDISAAKQIQEAALRVLVGQDISKDVAYYGRSEFTENLEVSWEIDDYSSVVPRRLHYEGDAICRRKED